jgi:hypothetical protein
LPIPQPYQVPLAEKGDWKYYGTDVRVNERMSEWVDEASELRLVRQAHCGSLRATNGIRLFIVKGLWRAKNEIKTA